MDENTPEQVQEHPVAPPLSDDEDEEEEDIYQSADGEEDEEVEGLILDTPNQIVLASLIEECHKCQSIPNEQFDTNSIQVDRVEVTIHLEQSGHFATVAKINKEVSTLFVSLDLSQREKELCAEKRYQIKSKLIIHPSQQIKDEE